LNTETLYRDAQVAKPNVEIPPEVAWLYRYRAEPWSFLTECVWTQDQTDKRNPIKQYPNRDYLRIVAEKMVNEYLLAIVKHRRMVITWTACGLSLWESMLFEGRNVTLMSKKEEDSDALVKQTKFIYDHIPRERMPFKPRMHYKFTEFLNLDLDSKIKGFAQGPDQIRQHTMSSIYADEFAFWDKAEETFVGMKPTLEGGGKVCLISTRFPGFFQHVIDDTIDER